MQSFLLLEIAIHSFLVISFRPILMNSHYFLNSVCHSENIEIISGQGLLSIYPGPDTVLNAFLMSSHLILKATLSVNCYYDSIFKMRMWWTKKLNNFFFHLTTMHLLCVHFPTDKMWVHIIVLHSIGVRVA